MKLRNKKTGLTGKLIDIDLDIYEDGAEIYISILLDNSGGECIDEQFHSINELKKFLEEWEDYTPAEPLIKDEKVKKLLGEVVELELAVNELSRRFDEFNKHYVELCREEEE